MTQLTIKRLLSIYRLREIAFEAALGEADASEFGPVTEPATWEALLRFHATADSCELPLYEYETVDCENQLIS